MGKGGGMNWESGIDIYTLPCVKLGFSGGSVGKKWVCNAGDLGSILGLGRSPGEGNGNSLQYSCLENSMDRANLSGYRPMGSQRVGQD